MCQSGFSLVEPQFIQGCVCLCVCLHIHVCKRHIDTHTETDRQNIYFQQSSSLQEQENGDFIVEAGNSQQAPKLLSGQAFFLREPSLFSTEASQQTEIALCKDNLPLRITECNCKP